MCFLLAGKFYFELNLLKVKLENSEESFIKLKQDLYNAKNELFKHQHSRDVTKPPPPFVQKHINTSVRVLWNEANTIIDPISKAWWVTYYRNDNKKYNNNSLIDYLKPLFKLGMFNENLQKDGKKMYSSCAVVGNSDVLAGKKHGKVELMLCQIYTVMLLLGVTQFHLVTWQ